MKEAGRNCELCSQRAAFYCAADSAYLCLSCDSRVHGANFLVARHLRHPLCSDCDAVAGEPIYGDGGRDFRRVCSSCSPEQEQEEKSLSMSLSLSSTSNDSACVSSTETSLTTTTKERRRSESSATSGKSASARFFKRTGNVKRAGGGGAVDERAEGIFVNWSRRLGLSDDSAAEAAARAMGFCLARLPGVPWRVSLAASFWFGVRLCSSRTSTCHNLRRVEEVSGVPAKMILAVDARLGREMRARRTRPQLEEGWAEC